MNLQNLIGTLLLLAFILSACNKTENQHSKINVDGINSYTPKEIVSFDHVEDKYFGHLGYESKVLENGNIVFPERDASNLFVINSTGELLKSVRKGRGPGEIEDAFQLTKDKFGGFYVFDQGNDKALYFDSNFEFVEEFIPKAFPGTSILDIYHMESGTLIFEMLSFSFLIEPDKNREKILAIYSPATQEYGEKMVIKDKAEAKRVNNTRVEDTTPILYSTGNLTVFSSEKPAVYIFDTSTNLIAELDANLDTVSIIPVKLPTELLSQAEIDSLENEYSSQKWDMLENALPEVKAQADKMLYHDGEFWLKSNLRGNYQKWFVVNMEGQILRTVNLPKESILMHVSD
jgi:hypothetical protein